MRGLFSIAQGNFVLNEPNNSVSKKPAPSAEVYKRFFERERQARIQAEQFLEVKSRELYLANQKLIASANELEKEVQRTNAVFETAADGIIIFDQAGKIESLNRAATNIFGFEQDAILGQDVSVLIPSVESLADFCTNKQNNEVLGRRKDGTTIQIEFVTSKFSHQDVVNYSGIVRDLTQRKSLEQRLAHAQKMESVGQLAAGVAHELNTPIQFVNDNTSFLKSSFEDLDKILDLTQELAAQCRQNTIQGEALKTAEAIESEYQRLDLDFVRTEIPIAVDQTLSGTKTLARIVKAMKVFSHPGSTKFEPVDLNRSLDSVLTIAKSEWRFVAELEKNFCPDLPMVQCLPGELNQAFLNLITNACHAMSSQSSGGTNRLTVGTLNKNDHVIIEISDTGPGIPESVQHRIFDPFFTTKSVGKGTGQGLSISYNIIVKLHGGELTFDSSRNGTTFRIRIPIEQTATE